MRNILIFVCILILTSCNSRERLNFNQEIAKNKTYTYNAFPSQMRASTQGSAIKGALLSTMLTMLTGPAYVNTGSGLVYNPYGANNFQAGQDYSSSLEQEEGAKITGKYKIGDPIFKISDSVVKDIEKKYKMKEYNKPYKGMNTYDEDYQMVFNSNWLINQSIRYGSGYKFRYNAFMSMADIRSIKEPKKYDGLVLNDSCMFESKETPTLEKLTADDAKLLKDFIKQAKDYCIEHFKKRIASGESERKQKENPKKSKGKTKENKKSI